MIKPDYYQGKSGDLIDHWYNKWGERADIIMVANVEKYLERFRDKNGLEDIEKAQTYLVRLKEKVEGRKKPGTSFADVLHAIARGIRRAVTGSSEPLPYPNDLTRKSYPLDGLVTSDGAQQYLTTDDAGNWFASRYDKHLHQNFTDEELEKAPEWIKSMAKYLYLNGGSADEKENSK
jgi:collagenase-like PrtC family protease